ncbi:MAG: type II secretion system protein GspN, partial [Desulfosarcina sp.]
MVSVKASFAYLLFALLAIILFLYLLFPGQAVKAYMDSRLVAIDPSLALIADTIRPAVPPGLKMTDVDLNRDSVRLAHIDEARISPDLTSLLRANKQARFQARLADGTIKGRATLEGESGSAGRLRVEADLSQIRLEQLDAVQAASRFTLSGTLGGRLTHDGGRAPMGITNGVLTVAGMRIALKSPFLGISELDLGQTEAEFSVGGQILNLKALSFNGPMLEGKISGTIDVARPYGQSRLNLTGTAKPRPELIAQLQETLPEGIVNSRTLAS